MDQFLAAWQDSDFTMTATQDPAPSTLPEMSNFDYEAGHVPMALGMPYDQLTQFEQIANEDDHPAQPVLDRWVQWFSSTPEDSEADYASMHPEVAGLLGQVDSYVNDSRVMMQDHNAEISAGGDPESGMWSEDFVKSVNNRLIRTMELQDQATDPENGAEAYTKLGQWYAGMQSLQQSGEAGTGIGTSYDSSYYPVEQSWGEYYQEYGEYYQSWADYETEMAENDAYWGDYSGAAYHAEGAEQYYSYSEDYESYADTSTDYTDDYTDTSSDYADTSSDYTDTSSDYSSTDTSSDYADTSDY